MILGKTAKAFTLVEMLLVLMIIGILAAFAVPHMAGQGEKARRAAARADIDSYLATALDMYELDNGRYPTSEQGLRALIEAPAAAPVPRDWNGPYLKKKRIPKDPWGNDYVYASPGARNAGDYDLSSSGRDGVESTDDVANWETEREGL
ncbi:MAG: type II secretion system major pseudopilin GspG [Candidatus Omnitrophota bacterium]|nr:type II secretion system major pseudopilin GspG [Candidatus Omnitrophota bacterium]MDZ4241364.1 type II secretion system major pseudopilin GspG [Candidatus Omnitrophota bacterium]